VREAVWELMLWWLGRGADGFRVREGLRGAARVLSWSFSQMDVINLISKTPGLPDVEVVDQATPFHPGHAHYVNGLVLTRLGPGFIITVRFY
jgi:oligo-1,6-glucosidase